MSKLGVILTSSLLLVIGATACSPENSTPKLPATQASSPTDPTASELLESQPTPQVTETEEPASTPTPEPTVEREPIIPLGAKADFTASEDNIGIEGSVEVRSATELVIRDFVFLVYEAPGVDIRLGIGDDFTDSIAVSLKDITGKEFDGRVVNLRIPDSAFDGRAFDSIAVYCYVTGEVFDSVRFE